MVVRLDAWWPRVTSVGLDAAAGLGDGVEDGLQLLSCRVEGQQTAGQDGLEGALGVGAIGA